MAQFSQLPATLDVTFVVGDEVNIGLDFTNDLTSYSFQNAIYVSGNLATGGGGNGFVNAVGATVTSFTVTPTDIPAGKIGIGLTETQTAALSPANRYRWYLRWVSPGNVTRTVLSGQITPVAP